MLQGVKLSKTQCPTTAEDRENMKDVPYASAIGSIMYAMLCTRPDVCLAISLAARYQSNPGVDHWTAVKNILEYLKRTFSKKDLGEATYTLSTKIYRDR